MGVGNLNVFQDNTGDEPKHALRETDPAVIDPAEDFVSPDEVPGDHDDVDVALQEGKDTGDGEGEDEVPPSDFISYADPTADDGEEQN